MALELFTASYADFDPAWGVPVRTSVGSPKWWAGPPLEHIRRVTPYGVFGVIEDRDEYAAAYLDCLDAAGVDALHERFSSLSAKHGGAPLVLLCFEDLTNPHAWCHRQLLASWIEDRLGLVVPELARQPSLFG
jgi:hypothetical protein